MAMVKIADLKNNLSRHLGLVKQGAQITVLDRDRPIARIIPFSSADAEASLDGTIAADAGRIADLVRQGVVTPGDGAAARHWLGTHRPLRLPTGGRGAVDVLLEMRAESTR